MDTQDKKRTQRLNVRLNSDLIEKLDVIASDLGVAPATLGAVAIGEFVNSKYMQAKMFSQSAELTASKSSEALTALLSDPQFLNMLASAGGEQSRLEGV